MVILSATDGRTVVVINDDKIESYERATEFARRHGIKYETFQQWVYRGIIESTTFLGHVYIKQGTPLPVDRRRSKEIEGYDSVKDFAKKYNISHSLVLAWIRRGKLNSIKVNRRNYIKQGTPLPVDHRYIAGHTTMEGYEHVTDFVRRHNVKYCTVMQWISRGKLESIKVGKFRYIKLGASIPVNH